MKKHLKSNILILLILIIGVPLIIYFATSKFNLNSLTKIEALNKTKGIFTEETTKTKSLKRVNYGEYNYGHGAYQKYTSDATDDGISGIILGTLKYSELGKEWYYSYTLREATYCCDSYWPLIKVKDGEFGDGVGSAYDYLGGEDDYWADVEFSRLPNRNGHLARIEYQPDPNGSYKNDLYKGITYLKWQGIASDYNIQRILWSSWVWYSALGYGVDYMGNNYALENKGVNDEVAYENVQYYCGRDSYVPSNIEPTAYDAHVQYSYGGPSTVGKDSGWQAVGVVDYYDSTDTNGDGIVSIEEQLAPYGGSVEAWRAAIIAGIEATYGPLSRTIQFATFEYQIIRRNFPVVCIADDIHAYVDQETISDENRLPSYTFGPYKLSMMDGSYNYGDEYCSNAEPGETLKLKELVYNEITGGNFGQKSGNTFLNTEFKVKVKYRNGTEREIKTTIKPKYNDSSAYDDSVVHSYQNESCKAGGVILVDAEGNALEEGFPKFDETFYIRYFVDDNENTLQELVGSNISFKYMGDEMKVSGYRFKSEKLAYSCHYNICKYFDDNEGTDCFGALIEQYPHSDYDFNELLHKGWKETPEGGEIYMYKDYSGGSDTADILEAIKLVEDGIASSSNRMSTSKSVKVYWGDDLTTDGDTNKVGFRKMSEEGGRSKYEDRCDGIFIDGCEKDPNLQIFDPYTVDYFEVPYHGVSETGKGFFPEYNDIDTFYNNTKNDYISYFKTYNCGVMISSYSDQTLANDDYGWVSRENHATVSDPDNLEESLKDLILYDNDWCRSWIDELIDAGLVSIKAVGCGASGNCDYKCTCYYCLCGDCECGIYCSDSKCSYGCKCGFCYDSCSKCEDDCEANCSCGTCDGSCAVCVCSTCNCAYHYIMVNNTLQAGVNILYKRDFAFTASDDYYYVYSDDTGLRAYNMYTAYPDDGVDVDYMTVNTYNYNGNGSIKKFYDNEDYGDLTQEQAMKDWLLERLAELFAKKMADFIMASQTQLKKWIYHENGTDKDGDGIQDGAYAGLYIPYITPETSAEGEAMPFVEEENDGFQPMLTTISGITGEAWHTRQNAVELPGYEINMFLGGNVTEEEAGMKGDGYNNVARSGGGVEVSLYNEDLKMFVAVTTTDQYGNYGFQYVNPLHQYKVVFKYNGMQYLMNPDYSRDISDPGNAERRRRRKSKRSRKWN